MTSGGPRRTSRPGRRDWPNSSRSLQSRRVTMTRQGKGPGECASQAMNCNRAPVTRRMCQCSGALSGRSSSRAASLPIKILVGPSQTQTWSLQEASSIWTTSSRLPMCESAPSLAKVIISTQHSGSGKEAPYATRHPHTSSDCLGRINDSTAMFRNLTTLPASPTTWPTHYLAIFV